jgi:vacuolar-type H+-ATPase subunit E/Vma4
VTIDRLRESFLAQVAAEAERDAATAERGRAARLEEAQRAAGELIRAGREAGERDAVLEAVRVRAGALRAGRAEILAARRRLYADLEAAALDGALALRRSPRYPDLLAGLSASATARLGGEPQLEVDPDPGGGVVARSGGRMIDATLPRLARRCLDGIGPRVEELWR